MVSCNKYSFEFGRNDYEELKLIGDGVWSISLLGVILMVSFPRKITPNSLLKVALLLSMAYGSLWYIVDRPPIITWMGYDKESSRFG